MESRPFWAFKQRKGHIQAESEKQLTRIRPKRIMFGVTVGGFRSSSLKSLQGWDESVLAEVIDLTFRVYLAGYKIQ